MSLFTNLEVWPRLIKGAFRSTILLLTCFPSRLHSYLIGGAISLLFGLCVPSVFIRTRNALS